MGAAHDVGPLLLQTLFIMTGLLVETREDCWFTLSLFVIQVYLNSCMNHCFQVPWFWLIKLFFTIEKFRKFKIQLLNWMHKNYRIHVVVWSNLISVNIPPLPKTKDQLKEKNRKLRKELDTLRRQYRENVWSVIENLKRHYDETKHDLTPSYETLKRLIKISTSDEVLEGCRVPEHKHSVQNKGIDHCTCNCVIWIQIVFWSSGISQEMMGI